MISKYGEDYELRTSKGGAGKFPNEFYRYKSLGFQVACNAYDKKKIVRVLSVFPPYEAETQEGINLGISKWSDLEDRYEKIWVQYGGKRIYYEKDSISYQISWDGKKRKVNKDAVIDGISVFIGDEYGGYSTAGFELDSAKIDSIQDHLIEFTNKMNTYSDFTNYLETNQAIREPFTVRRYFGHELSIEHGLQRIDLTVFYNEFNKYYFDLLCRNDTVVYGVMKSKDTTLSIFYKTTIVTRLVEDHNKIYGSDIDVYDPVQFPKKTYVHGYRCGYSGRPPLMRYEIDRLLENNDYETLATWLRSMNPEIQAYAYEGLLALSETGVYIKEEDIKIMEHLLNVDVELYACSGCLVGVKRDMSDVVKKKDIKKIRKRNAALKS